MKSLLDLFTDSAWITAFSTIVGSIVTYLIAKSKIKKELTINDRVQLSKDQYQLIAELRKMMSEQRDEIDNLREEIRELQEVNLNLTLENKQLQQKIHELTVKLEEFERIQKEKEGKEE